MGKTSAIPKVIATYEGGRKFIYCANRVQLLDEMEDGLKSESINFVHLRRDSEIVKSVIQNHKEALGELLGSSRLQKLYDSNLRKRQFLDAVSRLEQALDLPENPLAQGMVESATSYLINLFKRLFRMAPDGTKAWLRQQEVLRMLFPYIAFQDDLECRVLLITIQKLFHGFFDGETTLNLSRLTGDRAGHIVFLDEFDFLESNLVDLICQDSELRAPFQFVAHFYREMKRHRLPSDNYLNDKEAARVRKEIESIIQLVETLQPDLPYPDINLFTSQDKNLKNIGIFQTNRTVVSAPLYLEATKRSFDIKSRPGEGLRAYTLFNTVREAMNRILSLFKRLEPQNPDLYEELKRQCFEETNFFAALAKIGQLPSPSRPQPTRFDKLLDSGYSLYEIEDLMQRSDQNEVALRHYAMYTTPEKLLLGLINNNLVFGLSATGDIERCLGNFNMAWLRGQKGTNLIDLTQADKNIITHLNEAKAKARGNKIVVEKAAIEADDTMSARLREHVDALSEEEGFGTSTEHTKERVYSFFATLEWLLTREHRAGEAHLLFYNSFKQIEHVLVRGEESEPPLFEIEEEDLTGRGVFHTHLLTYRGKKFNVVFYNAEKARNLGRYEEVHKAYEALFWEDYPVLLVTTYPSAGNGINLQYRPSADSKGNELQDFTSNLGC